MADLISEVTALGPGDPPVEGVVVITFDVETIGDSMTKNAMVEVGCTAAPLSGNEPRILARFEGHMKIPEGCGFEERCEREFWDAQKPGEKQRVLTCQTEPEDVMRGFVMWVDNLRKSFGLDARRVRFATNAPYFDAAWMSYYLNKYADHNSLHTFFSEPGKPRFKPVLGTNDFFRGVARKTLNDELSIELGPDGWFSADEAVREALSIPIHDKPDVEHDHRAVHDAENILKKYLIVLKHLHKDKQETSPFYLVGVVNTMPHPCVVYAEDKKTVTATFNPSGPVLRLVGDASVSPIIAPLETGDDRVVNCRVGAPKYNDLNAQPPNAPVIVSDLVARHLLEKGFKYAIYSPDTSPEAVVRGDNGSVVGTTRLVYHV